jgi:hypothetical protein
MWRRAAPRIVSIGTALLGFLLTSALGPPSASIQSVRPAVEVLQGASPLAEIPFVLIDDHIAVQVRIGDSPAIEMILDTGMPIKGAMFLDRQEARKLDLKYSATMELGGGGETITRTADVVAAATLSLAGFAFPGQQVLVLRQTDFADDWPAGAILGTTFFDHVVEIDFSKSLIRLYKSIEDLPEDPGERLDLAFKMGIPVVEARIGIEGEDLLPVRLIADTGVNAPLLVYAHSDSRIRVPKDAVQTRSGVLSEGLAGDVKGEIGRVARFEIGPYDFREVVAGFPTEASMGRANMLGQNGFVGTGILKRFNVVFDYPNRHLYLRPNETYGDAFEWNMAGLLMGANREGFLQVKDVVEGSPGAQHDMRPNDVIVAVNGRDVRDLGDRTLQDLFNDEGAQLHLSVQRGSSRFEVTLTLRRII